MTDATAYREAKKRVRRRWVVYRNDHAPTGDQNRHLVCEHCKTETECGLAIGDNRPWAFNDGQRWYTSSTGNWSIPKCDECEAARTWKLERGYRGQGTR